MGHSISENSLSGRAPPCGGRSPSGGVPIRQGQGPFLFLRKKKRALTPKKNEAGLRGVDTGKTAACVFTHCGEDQPRPLRPCHCGTGMGAWFYPAAAWLCHSRGRVQQVSRSAAREAPHHPGRERGTRRRRGVRASACPCSPRAGRNGREGSFLSYESRPPPWTTADSP